METLSIVYLDDKKRVVGYATEVPFKYEDVTKVIDDPDWVKPIAKKGETIPKEDLVRPKITITEKIPMEDVDTDNIIHIKEESEIAVLIDNNPREYEYKNGKFKHIGKSEEDSKEEAEILAREKEEIKAQKIYEYKSTLQSYLEINSIIYSTRRADILKYKEATEISEGMGETHVKFSTGSGVVKLTIEDASAVVKTLSEKALRDYWDKQAFLENLEGETSD